MRLKNLLEKHKGKTEGEGVYTRTGFPDTNQKKGLERSDVSKISRYNKLDSEDKSTTDFSLRVFFFTY